jgi:hypothetical protein
MLLYSLLSLQNIIQLLLLTVGYKNDDNNITYKRTSYINLDPGISNGIIYAQMQLCTPGRSLFQFFPEQSGRHTLIILSTQS